MSNLFQRSPQMTTPPKPRSLAWRRLSKHRPPKAKTLWSINPCLEASCNCSREKFAFSSLNSIQSNMFLRKTYLDCFLRLLSWASLCRFSKSCLYNLEDWALMDCQCGLRQDDTRLLSNSARGR